MTDELVTGAEIARRLSLSRARVHQLAAADGFPESLGWLGQAKVWRWDEVREWAEERGRAVSEPPVGMRVRVITGPPRRSRFLA